jgi:flagellar motor switch protein FliM
VIHQLENDLMQLASFFTGSVHTDLRNPVDPSATRVKQRLVNELKRQLGVTTFTALASRQKFQVIQV